MFYYLAEIQYCGENYFGFQAQLDLKTIQNEINESLIKLIGGKVTTMGASRTDTGVHAYQQFLKMTCDKEINLNSFVEQINSLLPNDIRFLNIRQTTYDFRPNLNIKSKQYIYLFTNKILSANAPSKWTANISNPLDIEKMHQCLDMFLGEHDFSNFCSTGSNVKSTKRNIKKINLKFTSPAQYFQSHTIIQNQDLPLECYILEIEADGFLKQMIRHMVSALWMVGTGKMSLEEFNQYLNGPKVNRQLWKVAPSQGLILYRIEY